MSRSKPPAKVRPSMFILPRLTPDVSFGVLRHEFSDRVNSATAYIHSRLHPVAPAPCQDDQPGRIWRPTAFKSEVLLPDSVPDVLSRAATLLDAFEAQMPTRPRDLVIAIKLIFPEGPTLHASWERARRFAKDFLVDEHQLAVVMALHAPFIAAVRNPNPVHCHICALARKIGRAGFLDYSPLAVDAGHAKVVDAWKLSA